DSDGDQDLFIASGVITGMFPLSSPSHLLINDGGTFIEKTKEFFPSLKERMLCNQVVMSDIYGDSGLELIIVGEWMPITVYSKSEETWNDITAELGLDNEIGWWKQVEFADLDNDGDLDMVVGNEGLNSQYNASKSKPLVVDFGYLDENKKWDAIISQYTNWGLVPIYAKNEIEHQMKYFISSNYKYYSDYASSSTSTLLSNLNKAERIKVTELRSSVFINTEEGFKKQPLTNRCQVAPIEDIESIDINGDGNMDLLMVGNNYNNRIEYGWTDALNGLVLLGDGKGGFDVKELSGFYVPGNGKNIETIEIGGKTYFIVSQTHDKVRLFESLEK
ncbi:MAG: FG-GAP repeat domain-containing protein, partial [Bacteroidia bacterium]